MVYLLLLFQSSSVASALGVLVLLFLGALLYVLFIRPLLTLPGADINSVEQAAAFARHYHAACTTPFTRREEAALIRTLMRRYGLSEETSASIVGDTFPAHRKWEPRA